MSDTLPKVVKIVAEHLVVDEASVTLESKFTDDLGADSLDLVELVMAFEEAFSVAVPDDDVDKLQTVGDVVTYLEKASK